MTQKKITETETTNATANRFGIPIWTGKDVAAFRKDFAPKGKKKMSFDDLAALIGFNHRSQAKRLEDQEQISPSMSITLEYVKRLLTEERSGYQVDWKSGLEKKIERRETIVTRQDEFIEIDVKTGNDEDEKDVVNIYFAKSINLEIKNVANGSSAPLHRLSLE